MTRLANTAFFGLFFMTAAVAQAVAPASSLRMIVVNKYTHAISIYDSSTDREICETSAGMHSHDIAISPDGRVLYVPIYASGNVDAVGTNEHSLSSRQLGDATIPHAGGRPLHPKSHSCFGDPGLPANLSRRAGIESTAAATKSSGVPDLSGWGSVPELARSNRLPFQALIPVPGSPFVSRFSPNGKTLYTAGYDDQGICLWASNPGTHRVERTIHRLARSIGSLVLARLGRTLYLSDQDENHIVEISTSQWQITKTLAARKGPDENIFAQVR